MSIELLLIIFFITYWAAVSFAYWAGWRARGRQRPPGGSYGAPRRRGGPTTPKPQFPPGRVTDVHGTTIGYRPIPSGRDTISPPRNP